MAKVSHATMIFLPTFVGIHVAWYALQIKYVDKEAHHPFLTLYRKYFKKEETIE